MPDTLCRYCGGELEVNIQCPQCYKPLQMICVRCAESTEIQYHSRCNYEEVLCDIAALA